MNIVLPHGPQPDLHVCLLPDRAAWLSSHRLLLVADVHLGKAATFRSLGVPVPAGTTGATLARLSALVQALSPDRLVVLGDLLHGPAAQHSGAVDALADWRARHAAVAVTLVRGNHDDRAGDPPAHCGVEVVDEPLRVSGLALCHEPREDAHDYVIAGHLHPALRLGTRADSVRLPCFVVGARRAILPAFGEFTGGARVDPQPDDRLYVTDGERVHAVPAQAASGKRFSRSRA